MEAALLQLVLDIAAALLADVTQDLAQHPLQRVALHSPPLRLPRRGDGGIAVVADVESGAEQVAALALGISVAPLQALHIVLRPEYARHNDAVQRDTFYV